MKSQFFITAVVFSLLGLQLNQPYLFILSGLCFLLCGVDIYLANKKYEKLKDDFLKIEEAFGRLNKNEQTLLVAQRRLEDKVEAIAQGAPFSRKVQR
jgi:hypothetical protein